MLFSGFYRSCIPLSENKRKQNDRQILRPCKRTKKTSRTRGGAWNGLKLFGEKRLGGLKTSGRIETIQGESQSFMLRSVRITSWHWLESWCKDSLITQTSVKDVTYYSLRITHNEQLVNYNNWFVWNDPKVSGNLPFQGDHRLGHQEQTETIQTKGKLKDRPIYWEEILQYSRRIAGHSGSDKRPPANTGTNKSQWCNNINNNWFVWNDHQIHGKWARRVSRSWERTENIQTTALP